MKKVDTSSFEVPPPLIDPHVIQAISEAWETGEITIKPVDEYKGNRPIEAHEWYKIDWLHVNKNHETNEESIIIMYDGAYQLKTLFKELRLPDEHKLNGFLLTKLCIEMQLDGKGIIPPQIVNNR